MFENIKSMTTVDKYIAKKIDENKKDFLNYKISEFADLISVSSSALSRFVKRCNFDSYTALKLYILKHAFSNNSLYDAKDNKEYSISLKNIHKLYSESISEAARIPENKLNKIADDFIESNYVVVYGAGSSRLSSSHLANGLHKLGIKANSDVDFHNVIRNLESFKNIVLVIFSVNLDSMEVDFLIKESKKLNIKIWIVTAYKEKIVNIFANYISFKSFPQKDPFMAGPSKISMLFIADSILYSINEKINKENKKQESKIIERWKTFKG